MFRPVGVVVFAVALALLAPRLAGAEPSVKLVASPARSGEPARIRAIFPGPVTGPLRGAAALGQVGPFARVAPDTYEAEYVPPRGVGGAESLVVVYEDRPGGALAFTIANIQDTITLKTKVKSSGPLYVRAGPIRKGPFHADARGEVTLTFPSNGELVDATVESPQGKVLSHVSLRPNLQKTLLVGRPQRLHAGAAQAAEVLLVAPYDPAFRLDVPRPTATAGKVSVEPSLPSYGVRMRYQPPPDLDAPPTVKVADGFGRSIGSVTFNLSGPDATSIALQAPEHPLGAGETGQVTVAVTTRDGSPTDADLELTADSGTVSPPVPAGPGQYTVALTAPAHLPAEGTLHLRAQIAGNSRVFATASVPVHGGPPARVVFRPTELARAGEKLKVELQVLDEGGNPAEPQALAVSADRGEVAEPERERGGLYVVEVRTPEEARGLTLTARDGQTQLQGEQELKLAPAAPVPFALVGLQGGFGSNLGELSAPTLGVAGEFHVGPRIGTAATGVGFQVGYLPEVQRDLTSDRGTHGDLHLQRVALLARFGAFQPFGSFALYGGVALGVQQVSGQLEATARPPVHLDGLHPAGGAYGGAGYRLGPGFLALELRATYASVDVTSGDVQVSGPVGGLDGAVSYLFAF